jgi:cytoskeleton protein RodZ
MASFGDRLRKEREQRGITLDDIALNTKIGTRLLRALEEEKFDQLPGGIFNKGFVRAYARHVGIDEDQAIADYMTAVNGPEVKVVPTPRAGDTPAETPAAPALQPRIHVVAEESVIEPAAASIPWGLLALVLLLIALAFASWSYYHREQQLNQNRAPLQPRVPAMQGTGARTSTEGSATSSAATAAPVPISPTPAAGVPFTSAARAVQAASSFSPRTPGTFAVLLKESEESDECWVSIAVDGNPPYEATLVAPTQKQIVAKNEVVVKAGNVGALDFFFNGKKLPTQGEYGKVKTLTFHADGLQATPAQPAVPQ